jgi:hypothetical protein
VVLGLRFRAGMLMAATLLTVILGLAVLGPYVVSGWRLALLVLELVVVLQLAYVAGLAIAALWRRLRGQDG